MKQPIKFKLDDQHFLWVEVDESEPAGGVVPAGRAADLAAEAGLTFKEAFDNLSPALNEMITRLRDLVDKPEEVALEFGLKLNGKLGVVIASTGIEGNFQVKLKWKK